ncbi:hypothetical protein QSV34_06060 [Porticoccus sp. W117]|uniref:CC0125/CC1285 family lipoprotein n=1 Tax=Porticoccus sp. W117 TaxID=3054777 RepID=UPI002593FCAB|nr:hypothetical protein [Porticoccus sp. W117]MDM3870917.1 hypothetical protein [Porticoccus sp. W117]
MKVLTVLIIASIFLAGCGASNYRAAKNYSDHGYIESQLRENIYRLQYLSPKSASGAHASDLVLLRAAELALSHNYPSFVVLDRADEVRDATSYKAGRRETEVTFRNYDSQTGSGTGDAVTRVTGGATFLSAEPRSLLLVQFVKEKKPLAGKLAYDAQFVRDSIRAKYQLKDK